MIEQFFDNIKPPETEFWVGPKEVGFVFRKGKIEKIIPSNSFYKCDPNDFKIFHLTNRNLELLTIIQFR